MGTACVAVLALLADHTDEGGRDAGLRRAPGQRQRTPCAGRLPDPPWGEPTEARSWRRSPHRPAHATCRSPCPDCSVKSARVADGKLLLHARSGVCVQGA